MSASWIILTSEYPPQPGGVSDFCKVLAHLLARSGAAVEVWAPTCESADRDSQEAIPGASHPVVTRRVPDLFGPSGRSRLAEALGSTHRGWRVLVQYVPNAFGLRGMNLPMCSWIARQRKRGADVRVLFHEPFFYFGWRRPQRNLLAVAHRIMAWRMLSNAVASYVSTPSWLPLLAPYQWLSNAPLRWLPFPATLPVVESPNEVSELRRNLAPHREYLVGHFGTYGDDITRPLRPIVRELLKRNPGMRFVCVGRRSEQFAAALSESEGLARARVLGTGTLDERSTSLFLQACDAMVQPYPDGATARRTSLINLLAHGLPVVTTQGELSESFWQESQAVDLRTPGDVTGVCEAVQSISKDAARTLALGFAARRFHERHFSEAHLLSVLNTPLAASETNR